jgi:hypothetical protein
MVTHGPLQLRDDALFWVKKGAPLPDFFVSGLRKKRGEGPWPMRRRSGSVNEKSGQRLRNCRPFEYDPYQYPFQAVWDRP